MYYLSLYKIFINNYRNPTNSNYMSNIFKNNNNNNFTKQEILMKIISIIFLNLSLKQCKILRKIHFFIYIFLFASVC